MPRRIVIACWGSYGDVYPYVGLAKALKSRGHMPLVAAPGYYRPTLEQEEIEFVAIGPDVDPTDREMIARVMHPVTGTEAVVRDLVTPALRQSYEELLRAAEGADLVVTHPLTFAAPMVAQKHGLRWVSTLLAPLGFFSITDLPVLPPAPWLVHFRRLGPWFGRTVVALSRRATRDWMEPVYRLRAELGLPRGGHPLFYGQFSPSMTLALFSRLLAEPQPDWPPHVRTTGFVFYNGPAALDPALASFLDEAEGSPPVVFTLGSSAVGAAGRFYHESVDAVARLGVRAVLLTGGFAENLPAGALPPGVMLINWRLTSSCFLAPARSCIKEASARRRRRCAADTRCWWFPTDTISRTTPFASRTSASHARCSRVNTRQVAWLASSNDCWETNDTASDRQRPRRWSERKAARTARQKRLKRSCFGR